MRAEVRSCASCGSEHLAPVPCGLSFRNRIRTVRLDPSALPNTTKNYFDTQALDDQLGGTASERVERVMEETDGLGYVKPVGPDGRPHHRDRKTGDVVPVTTRELERITTGPEVG